MRGPAPVRLPGLRRAATKNPENTPEGGGMLLNQERARGIFEDEGLDAVILSTPGNVLYASDCVTEFMLGRFEDFTAAVVLTADDTTAPALIVPEFDLPFLAENSTWIEDIRAYGNPWSSVGVFMGQTLDAHLDTPLRGRLKVLRTLR